MFREYEAFKSTLATVSARLDDLQKDLTKKQADKAAAEEKYQQMLEEDAIGEVSHSTDSLNKAKKKVADLEGEIQIIQERRDMVLQARSNKAKEMIGTVEDGWKQEVAAVRDELQLRFHAMLEHRAKLMLDVQNAHELYRKADDLLRVVNEASRMADPEKYTFRTQSGVSHYLPDDIFTGENKGVIPTTDELNRVYTTGWLPDWVKHYAATGEIVSSESLKLQKVQVPTPDPEPAAEPAAEPVAENSRDYMFHSHGYAVTEEAQ